MLIGVASGVSPMPKPIPAAIVGKMLGAGTPKPLLMSLAVLSHLAYGGFWGGIVAAVTKPITVRKGIAFSALLWLVMQVMVLPFLGWGAFGSSVSLKIAVATLVLHLVYGFSYGALMGRSEAVAPGASATS